MTEVWKPHATVAAIIEDNGRFLMVEEISEGRTVYNQPAGHLDPGESLIDAVIREAREETAWSITPRYLSGIYRWDQPETSRCFLRFAFVADAMEHYSHEPLDDGIIRSVWMSRDDLASQPDNLRSPMVLNCIDDYLRGQQFPLDILVDVNA